jgi:hypothetical protein
MFEGNAHAGILPPRWIVEKGRNCAKGPVMSSPYGSAETIGNTAHQAYALVIDPHVATAIWAIVLAIACAVVMVVAEMVKQRNAPADTGRDKTPPS